MPKTVIVSGGFDPLHSGHIAYLQAARDLGDYLVVGVNSDAWLICKKGRAFMPLKERMAVVNALGCVGEVMSFDDRDGTALSLIEAVKAKYPDNEIVFANGGDRTAGNIPEMAAAGVEFAFGVGGESKLNSSLWILQEWQAPRTEKPWGYYTVLHEAPEVKVKELVVEPGASLSLQRHKYRSEHWHVAEGLGFARLNNGTHLLYKHDTLEIPCGAWHQLANLSNNILRIVEIQYGERCEEEDIERRANDLSVEPYSG